MTPCPRPPRPSARPTPHTLSDLLPAHGPHPDPASDTLYTVAAQLVMLATHPHLDLLVIRGVDHQVVGAQRLSPHHPSGPWGDPYQGGTLPAHPGASHCAAFVCRSQALTPASISLTALIHAARVLHVRRDQAFEHLTQATLQHALTVDRTRPDAQGRRARHHSLMRLETTAQLVLLHPERLAVHDWDDVPCLDEAAPELEPVEPAPQPMPQVTSQVTPQTAPQGIRTSSVTSSVRRPGMIPTWLIKPLPA